MDLDDALAGHRDGGGRRGGPIGPRSGSRGVEPGGQRLGGRVVLAVVDGDGDAALQTVGQDRRATGADDAGEQGEDAGEPGFGGPVGGELVERSGQQAGLLVDDPVLGPTGRQASFDEAGWGGEIGRDDGQPDRTRRQSRSEWCVDAALPAIPRPVPGSCPFVPVGPARAARSQRGA